MVAMARSGLENNDTVTLPYICKISGAQEELILISDSVAEELADLSDKLSDSVDAVLVASVARAELCICDLATLAGRPESEIQDRLERLMEHQLVSHRLINGMNYFHMVTGFEAEKLRKHIIERDHQSQL
jgi:hypothetical protein